MPDGEFAEQLPGPAFVTAARPGILSPPGGQAALCDPSLPSALSPVPHDYDPDGDEYGSLAAGGSYRRLRCRNCHRVAYDPLPD